jgi:hypothetical protein
MKLAKEDLDKFLKLLSVIKVSPQEFDEFISRSPHIIRSIRGHAFEVWLDRELLERGYKLEKSGGDTVVDRLFSGTTLQLKTSFQNGSREGVVVSFKMHKTHGAEIKPLCFYKPEEFADYFVGMHPTLGVIICPKDKLKTRADINPRLDYGEYISDPLPFEWETEWLNRYELLGMKISDPPKIQEHDSSEAILFPHTINKIGFTDYDIVHSILDEANFRIWRQLIVGTIREFHFELFARKNGITLLPPTGMGGRGNQKVDYLLPNGAKIQVKGLTKGMCHGDLLGCETQCSHGRVPTRLYQRGDFDYIAIVIDPGSISQEMGLKLAINVNDYNFAILPIGDLPVHPRSSEWGKVYIKSQFLFQADSVPLNKADLLKASVGNKQFASKLT